MLSLLVAGEAVAEADFEGLRESQDLVEEAEEEDDILPMEAETEEAAHQGPLASETPDRLALGSERIEVRQEHGGEGVAAALELGSAGLPVQELQASEVQSERSSEGPGLEVVGPPGGTLVREDHLLAILSPAGSASQNHERQCRESVLAAWMRS